MAETGYALKRMRMRLGFTLTDVAKASMVVATQRSEAYPDYRWAVSMNRVSSAFSPPVHPNDTASDKTRQVIAD